MKPTARGLPLTLDVEGMRVILIGPPADEEVARKRALLEEAGALVEEQAELDAARVPGARLVMLCVRDRALADRVQAEALSSGVLCWCMDEPARSDFAMPAIARLGPAQISVATSGHSPALGSRIRAALEDGLGVLFARFVEQLGELRARVQAEEPDVQRRRSRLHQALDGFQLEIRARYPDWFR